jgi:hypothetical protein
MNSAMITVIIHGVLAFCLAVGGWLALRYGFVLFREGHGTGRSGASIAFGKLFKASANSVGAVLMITAVAWGWLAVTALPNYSSPQERVAYTFHTPTGDVKVPELSVASNDATNVTIEPAQLLPDFKLVVAKANQSHKLTPTISGHSAPFDLDSVRYFTDSAGKGSFSTKFMTDGESALVTYRALKSGDKIVFMPEYAEVVPAPKPTG